MGQRGEADQSLEEESGLSIHDITTELDYFNINGAFYCILWMSENFNFFQIGVRCGAGVDFCTRAVW